MKLAGSASDIARRFEPANHGSLVGECPAALKHERGGYVYLTSPSLENQIGFEPDAADTAVNAARSAR
ncbi:hypothetical protein AWB68_05523 [Caballeronia choica]|jgi:hypothetical protein|uniref:Uncharacterized protein n=1 Tax=Caballeronia choica TaxID=326476 RepID=A0A158KER3_9BURK|nr:hypothetical protein AWB68_05523 [Caballeronia choica]